MGASSPAIHTSSATGYREADPVRAQGPAAKPATSSSAAANSRTVSAAAEASGGNGNGVPALRCADTPLASATASGDIIPADGLSVEAQSLRLLPHRDTT
jgi:hypothetical protein